MNKRLTNIDALRCISMMLIVATHYFNNVADNAQFELNSLDYFLSHCISVIGVVGVNIFVLISGYFLIDSKFKIKRLVDIWIQTIIYSVVFYVIFASVGAGSFSIKNTVSALTPVYGRTYWFATEYIKLYLLFPFLNILIRNLSKRQHKFLIGLLVIFNSVLPSFLDMSERLKALGNWNLWFITLYIIVAYIKIYKVQYTLKTLIIGWSVCTVAMLASKVLISNLTYYVFGYEKGVDLFIHNNSILLLGASVALFMLFLNWNVKNKYLVSTIKIISPLTFGVYLIHENPYVKSVLYKMLHNIWGCIGVNSFANGWLICGIISVIVIFIICCCIDAVRRFVYLKTFEKNGLFMKAIAHIQRHIDNLIEN